MPTDEAALTEINMSFTCADVRIGDAVLLCKAQRKKSAPRRTPMRRV